MAKKPKVAWGPNLSLHEITTWNPRGATRVARHMACPDAGWLVVEDPAITPGLDRITTPRRLQEVLRKHRVRCSHCRRLAGKQIRRYLLELSQENRLMLYPSGSCPWMVEVKQPIMAVYYRSEDAGGWETLGLSRKSAEIKKPYFTVAGKITGWRNHLEELNQELEDMDFSHLAANWGRDNRTGEKPQRREREAKKIDWAKTVVYSPNSYYEPKFTEQHKARPKKNQEKVSTFSFKYDQASKVFRRLWKTRRQQEDE